MRPAVPTGPAGSTPPWAISIILAIVAVGITVLVYGVVGVIVKMDDVGLHLTTKASSAAQRIGRGIPRDRLRTGIPADDAALDIEKENGVVLHALHEQRVQVGRLHLVPGSDRAHRFDRVWWPAGSADCCRPISRSSRSPSHWSRSCELFFMDRTTRQSALTLIPFVAHVRYNYATLLHYWLTHERNVGETICVRC